MALLIQIQTIPHSQQRYETVGDWWLAPDASVQIRVSQMSDWRHEALVAHHELTEALLCMHDGVSVNTVDRFDIAYEANRPEGDTSEAGDAPDAPYRKQHCVATGFERMLAALLDVIWIDYEAEIDDL